VSTEFFVHEEAVAQTSKPLHTLVKGGLSEAQAVCTTWKDVDKETFKRFIQFAYTGDYSILKPVTRASLSKYFAPEGLDEYNPAMKEYLIEDSIENDHIVEDIPIVEPASDTDDVLMFQPPAIGFQQTASAFGLQPNASAFGFQPTANDFAHNRLEVIGSIKRRTKRKRKKIPVRYRLPQSSFTP